MGRDKDKDNISIKSTSKKSSTGKQTESKTSSGYQPTSKTGQIIVKEDNERLDAFRELVPRLPNDKLDEVCNDPGRPGIRAEIGKILNESKDDELGKKTKAPVYSLKDNFKEHVLDPAREFSNRWGDYQLLYLDPSTKKVEVGKKKESEDPHEAMLKGFEVLKLCARTWLKDNVTYGNTRHKTKADYCKKIIAMADQGIKEVLCIRLTNAKAQKDGLETKEAQDRLANLLRDETIKDYMKFVSNEVATKKLPKDQKFFGIFQDKEFYQETIDKHRGGAKKDEHGEWQDGDGLTMAFVEKITKEYVEEADRVFKEMDKDFPTKAMKERGGFPSSHFINPAFPSAARPKLKAKEAEALNTFSMDAWLEKDSPTGALRYPKGKRAYEIINEANLPSYTIEQANEAKPFLIINQALRDKKEDKLPPPFDKTVKRLRKAFKKAGNFPEPVKVEKRMGFFTDDTNTTVDEKGLLGYVEQFQKVAGKDDTISLPGFISTAPVAPLSFPANVLLKIEAKTGLDMSPYTNSTDERELLLNDGTNVWVESVVKSRVDHPKRPNEQIDFYTIVLIQCLGAEKK